MGMDLHNQIYSYIEKYDSYDITFKQIDTSLLVRFLKPKLSSVNKNENTCK